MVNISSLWNVVYAASSGRLCNVSFVLQVLSSTNGDLLADEIVNENPNPQLATPVDIEVVEETKYDRIILCGDVRMWRCFLLCVMHIYM